MGARAVIVKLNCKVQESSFFEAFLANEGNPSGPLARKKESPKHKLGNAAVPEMCQGTEHGFSGLWQLG